MKTLIGFSSIALLTLAGTVTPLAATKAANVRSTPSPVQRSEAVEITGLFDVIEDVIETTDDVLDIQEQERRREEEREARAQAARERQQLIEIERMRQERLSAEQRAEAERQRAEIERQQAERPPTTSGNQQDSGVQLIYTDDNPARCRLTQNGSVVADACNSFKLGQAGSAYFFTFLFDDEPISFVAVAEPMESQKSASGTLTVHPFASIAYGTTQQDAFGGCVLNLTDSPAVFNSSATCFDSEDTIEIEYRSALGG